MIGLGYIGLPTAALVASRGLQVIGVDVNEETVATLNQGLVHIVEPDLDKLVHQVVKEGKMVATTTPETSDVFVIAVPTPFTEGFKPDLSYVRRACIAIAPVLEIGNLVILESTSPVGATDQMVKWLADERPDLTFPDASMSLDEQQNIDVHVSYCPERVLPGKVLTELVANDRVIGGVTPQCATLSAAFYKRFVEGECLTTNARTAELAKLTENSFRDVNIAFANELSMICEKFDINVWELIELTNRHPRVDVLQPGCGVGGHCIAVDPWFIVDSAPELSNLIRTAREVNDSKPQWVMAQVEKMLSTFLLNHPTKSLSEVSIACFGLAFKPNIDDLRESPALQIAEMIADKYASSDVRIVEPNITVFPATSSLNHENASLVSTEQGSVADIKLILVAHDAFKAEEKLSTGTSLNVAWAT
jgi:UDP-N-acetyl-D-mannosaminuronic acid dehydrogenase